MKDTGSHLDSIFGTFFSKLPPLESFRELQSVPDSLNSEGMVHYLLNTFEYVAPNVVQETNSFWWSNSLTSKV